MFDGFSTADSAPLGTDDYELIASALRRLPDRSTENLTELADRIGAQKLKIISRVRTDLKFARLVASKICQ
jgi:hypothetical protein